MAHGMPGPCEFPSLDSCHRRLLWAHKEGDLATHLVVGPILQVEDAKQFSQLVSKFDSLDPFLRVGKQDPCLTTVQEDGDNERLVQLELAYEADGVASPDPV